METTFRRVLKAVYGKWQEGIYQVRFIVGNLATIEVDSSTSNVDSTSLRLERMLLGNYFQEGPEGSFQEMFKYQNLLHGSVAKGASQEASQKLPSARALKVVLGKWQEGTYSFVVGDLATIEVDISKPDVDSASLQLEWKLLGNYLQQCVEGSFQEVSKN